MDEHWLEIREYRGEGYLPLVDFGGWRVAVLRFLDELLPERIEALERHHETDEVFVLLEGRSLLLLGGNGPILAGVFAQPMEPGKLYNVKADAWHSVLLSRDATVLIVENRDTAKANSEYIRLGPVERRQVVEIGRNEGY